MPVGCLGNSVTSVEGYYLTVLRRSLTLDSCLISTDGEEELHVHEVLTPNAIQLSKLLHVVLRSRLEAADAMLAVHERVFGVLLPLLMAQ